MASSSRNRLCVLFALISIGIIFGETEAKPPSRISGASDAPPGVYTYAVSIGLWTGRLRPAHICGGAIISSRHILTAGHCAEGKDLRKLLVTGGSTDLRDFNVFTRDVVKAFIYPGYIPEIANVQTVDNDVAILVLDRELRLGGAATAIALPTAPPKNHQQGSVVGWGFIDEDPVTVLHPKQPTGTMTLKRDTVEVLDDVSCRRWSRPVSPSLFCGLQRNGNILSGDSGGPLVSDGVIIGLVSSGYGIVHVPDFYTNVYTFVDWIKSVIEDPNNQ